MATLSAVPLPTRFRVPRRIGPPVVVALAAAAATAFAVVVAVRGGAPFAVDLAVRDAVRACDHGWPRRTAEILTLLGTGPVLYPVLLVLCAVPAAAGRTLRGLAPVAALAAGQVLELVLFAPLHRPAPGMGAGPSTLLATTYSSGRTAAAVLGWGLIVWQALRWRGGGPPPPSDRRVWAVGLAVGTVVGTTRIWLGVHWLTDALAGLAAGWALLAVALTVLTRTMPVASPVTGPLVPRPRTSGPPPAPRGRPPVPARSPGRGVRDWLRTSRWAWSVPVAAALVPVGPILAAPPGERLKDLLVYHGAGGIAGAGENLYAFRTGFAMPFTYPPFAALVLEPLARMPLGLAQTLWTAASLAAVVALAATVLRPVADRIGLPLTVAALLISSPVRSHLRFGQVGLFLVLLVALDLLQRTGGRRTAGAGLGMAVAIKLTPAVFLPWLAVTRQWRRLRATLLWCGGATLAGVLLLWPSSGDYLLRASRDTSRFGANDVRGNQSVRGMLLRALPEPLAERLWLVCALVMVAVATWQAWRCERAGQRLAALGVLVAASVAASPISWVHHLVFLALPVAALAAAGRLALVTAWYAVLVVSFPSVGHALATVVPALRPLGTVLIELQGLTAVAAVVLLPALVGVRWPWSRAAPPSAEGTGSVEPTVGGVNRT